MVIVHTFVNGITSECPPSYILLSTITINASILIYLFGDFYVQSYLKKKNNECTVKLSNGKHSNGQANGHSNVFESVHSKSNGADKKEL